MFERLKEIKIEIKNCLGIGKYTIQGYPQRMRPWGRHILRVLGRFFSLILCDGFCNSLKNGSRFKLSKYTS